MGTSVIIGRTCSKEQLGLYASGLSLILLVTAIQAALITVPYTISSPRIPKEDHPLYKGSTILQQLLLVSMSMLVFLCIGLFGSAQRSSDLRMVFLALSAICGFACFRDFVRRVSYAELHYSLALILDSCLAVLQVGAIGLLAWKHQLNASRALIVVGISCACTGVAWLAISWKTISFSHAHAINGFRVNWALGRWLVSSSVLWSICIDQYPWLITSLRAPVEAATWAAAYGVMAFLNPIVLALNNDVAPRVSHDYAAHGMAGLTRSVNRSAVIAGLITLPVLAGLVLFGSKLVRLMYGAKFGNTGVIVDLLAVGLWFYAIGLSFPIGMLALKRAGVDFAINVACIASFLAFGILLIHRHGVFGAACSFLMVQTVALVLRVVLFRRVVKQAAGVRLDGLMPGAAA
jgi:O-antigen/teichoic acid export membrane protein